MKQEINKISTQDRHLQKVETDHLPLAANAAAEHLELVHQKLQLQYATLQNEYKLLQDAGRSAQLGGWQMSMFSNMLNWTLVTKEIHEVPQDCEPSFEFWFNFYKEGEHRNRINVLINSLLENQIPFDEEFIIITAKGKEIWVRVIGQPVIENGKLVSIYGSFQDIDDRKKTKSHLLESRLNLLALMKNSPFPIFIKNTKGKYLDANVAYEKLIQYPVAEVIGRSDDEFFSAEVSDWAEQTDQVVVYTKKSVTFEKLLNIASEKITLQVIKFPILDEVENAIAICGIAIDISERIRTEEQLMMQEQQLLTIYNNVTDLIFMIVIDKGYRYKIISVNNTFSQKTGLRKEQVIGQYIDYVLVPDEAVFVLSMLNEVISKKKSISWEQTLHFAKAGITGMISVAPVMDESNNCIGLVCSIYDNTERMKAEADLQQLNHRLQLATRASNVGIWDWDILHNEMLWDDAMLNLYGLDKKDFKGGYQSWQDGLHPDDKQRVGEEVQKALDGKKEFNSEFRIAWPDGSRHYVKAISIVQRDKYNEPLRMIGTSWDITLQKESEATLSALNKQLLEKATALSASNADLERFAYMASHDLQEPLRMVSSFLNLVQKKYESLLDEQGISYIAYAVDGAGRMKQMINDLLEYSRVESGEQPKSTVDMNDTLAEVKRIARVSIQQSNATIKSSLLPVLIAEKTSMLQLLQNLVTNAIKYSLPGVAPIINITAQQNEDHHLFVIEDNGIGMENKFLDKIFIVFKRLHNKDDYSGSGIGLSICKKIVEKHGGTIWAESLPGLGSKFYFTIPIQQNTF